MSSPVVRGTTCMVQHLSCAHRRTNTCHHSMSNASYMTKPITCGATCMAVQHSAQCRIRLFKKQVHRSAATLGLFALIRGCRAALTPASQAVTFMVHSTANGALSRCSWCAGAVQRQLQRPGCEHHGAGHPRAANARARAQRAAGAAQHLQPVRTPGLAFVPCTLPQQALHQTSEEESDQ